jgi:hypothetical protein
MTLRVPSLAAPVPAAPGPEPAEPPWLLPTVSLVEQTTGGAWLAVAAMLLMGLVMRVRVLAERCAEAERLAQARSLAPSMPWRGLTPRRRRPGSNRATCTNRP